MDTKICDRCGQKFSIKHTCSHNEINMITKAYSFGKWTKANESTVNLCPECSDSFNHWWNNIETEDV